MGRSTYEGGASYCDKCWNLLNRTPPGTTIHASRPDASATGEKLFGVGVQDIGKSPLGRREGYTHTIQDVVGLVRDALKDLCGLIRTCPYLVCRRYFNITYDLKRHPSSHTYLVVRYARGKARILGTMVYDRVDTVKFGMELVYDRIINDYITKEVRSALHSEGLQLVDMVARPGPPHIDIVSTFPGGRIQRTHPGRQSHRVVAYLPITRREARKLAKQIRENTKKGIGLGL